MRNKLLSISFLSLALAGFSACQETSTEAPATKSDTAQSKAGSKVTDIKIKLTTSKGVIEGTIFASKTPMTAANYLNLAKRGYYNGLKFHRVIPDFMIQGGDPQGTGSGGPGYNFKDETRKDLKHDKPGIFSMANSDNPRKPAYSNSGSSNGSQFFITHVPTAWLDGKHTVFGEVTKGQDVVNKIAGGDTITKIEVLDSTDALFAAEADNLKKWNTVLDKNK
jgi:peptidyl-prolyl cis-trans isomerase B (cyclophilin B)